MLRTAFPGAEISTDQWEHFRVQTWQWNMDWRKSWDKERKEIKWQLETERENKLFYNNIWSIKCLWTKMFGSICLQFIGLINFNTGLLFFNGQGTEVITFAGPWNWCKIDDGAADCQHETNASWLRMGLAEILSSGLLYSWGMIFQSIPANILLAYSWDFDNQTLMIRKVTF